MAQINGVDIFVYHNYNNGVLALSIMDVRRSDSMKRVGIALIACLLCALLAGFALAEQAEAPLYDDTCSGWHIVVENVMVRKDMRNVTVDLGYTDVETSEYAFEASEGKLLCLVKLNIEKAGSRENIDWQKMLLTDSQGREYTRMEDEFIADLGMKHMTGLALNFGVNEGWIAYEIDEDAEGLTLSYAFEEAPFTCALNM